MSSDLVPTSSSPLTDRIRYAQELANATLLPPAYRKQPSNVLLAMEYGRALGLDTITAIQSVHVVDGKPTASSQLIGGLVRRAGHRLRVDGNDQRAVAEIVRRDDPEFTFRSEWTIERARAAGLTGKGVWKTYPAAMLKARAITEVARDACPEALSGVSYTSEELGYDGPTPDPAPMLTAPTVPVAALTGPGSDPIDAVIVEDGPITPDQMKLLSAVLADTGIVDKKQRLDVIEAILGRPIDSAKNLTENAADAVIGVLDAIVAEHRPADTDQPLAVVLAAVEAWS